MSDYLLVADRGDHERYFSVGSGPLDPTLTAVMLAYAHMLKEGLKVAFLYVADDERWFVRLELP